MSLQRNFASKKAGVTDGIISPVSELSEKGLRPGEALTRRGVELRSRPVGRVTDGIISPVGELSEKGLRPGEALTRRGVELRSRPVGRVTDGTRKRNLYRVT